MANNNIKYYTIGEVSDMLGIRESTLRYWQKEFDELNPQRTSSNRRLFTENDIKIIRKIYHLRNDLKYTIAGAKEELAKDSELKEMNRNNANNNSIDNKKEIEQELKYILKILENSE